MTGAPGRWQRHIGRPADRRAFLAVLALSLLVLAALYVNGLLRFVEAIPTDMADRDSVTDAIVVLTGGSLRVATGFRLLHEGKAGKLFVSGVHRTVEPHQLLASVPQLDQMRAKLECCVTLGYAADDTIGNALETAGWAAATGIRSFRLVTASYHMQRSLLEFHRIMPRAHILPHPVFPPNFQRDGWWRHPGTAGLILAEYNKILVARLRHELTDSVFPR